MNLNEYLPEAFDPTWLADLVEKEALKQGVNFLEKDKILLCTQVFFRKSDYYFEFMSESQKKVNKYLISAIIDDPERGPVIIDVAENKNIISLEILNKIKK